MNLENLKCCISHDESMVQSFMEDPEYASFYLQSVLADGDLEEIREAKGWIDEARARLREYEQELEAVEA